ncbi:MAG: protein translocase subunit SecD [Victivallales bacterium]|nr:protein translocase subunit SecD [Victivallales bacterium]
MKKSLLIRWLIILVIVGGWCYSIFPVKDRDFLSEFMRLSKKTVATLEKHAEKATALQQKLDTISDPSSKDYQSLLADIKKISAETGEVPGTALEKWKELNERIAKLQGGQDLAGNPLPEGTRLSAYQIVELAARGDTEHRSIRLCNFINVPHAPRANNKTVLRYVRNRTAGKLRLGLDLQGGTEFVISFDKNKVADNVPVEIVRDQILEILRNRLDKSGVTEPEIKAISETDISIRMPSVDEGDKTGIRNTIKDAAKLEFYLVDRRSDALARQYQSDPNFVVPSDVMRVEIVNERNGEEMTDILFLERQATPVRGEDVKAAFATTNQFGQWIIALSFNDRGAAAFGEVTSANVGRNLAIMLDGTVYSAPRINTAITGGSAEITGSFTYEEARRLAGVISSGNLPVSIDLSSEFGTEPSLGADSVKSGLFAGILGLVVVFIFMVIYYRFCGVVADLALAVNTILVLGTMALTKATITLPGIAGMVLTIGMAVDANILIFERIREELATGKTLANAIKEGYAHAFWAIFDSNLTTLLTCFFLYKYGSGTVQGFAVTLAFGIVSSMFTALFMTHAIFDLFTYNGWLKGISMMRLAFLTDTKIDFFKWMKPALALSAVLILLGIFGPVFKSGAVMGIDFAGGTQITYACDGVEPDVAAVRAFLENDKGYKDVKVGYKRGQSGAKELEIVVPALDEDANVFSDALDAKFPECKISQSSIYQVGPSVGSKFRKDSIVSALLAFIAIIVYLAFRFEFRYGVAAVAAVLHDVIVSAGIFIVFFGGQISLTVIAALMTIIGYSLNDTIVIFDRVRETQEKRADVTYRELMNLAINNTLSRTILTTITTLFVVVSLLIFGGGAVGDFAKVMFFGLITGTYSTIFIATAIVANWHKHTKQDSNELSDARKAAREAKLARKAAKQAETAEAK